MSVEFHIGKGGGKTDHRDFYTENFSHYLLFALNFVQDEEACKDIVQEVFIRYWAIQERFGDEISVKAFIYKGVRNGCLNHIRHLKIRSKYQPASEKDVSSEDFFMETIIREEVASIVIDEIGRLSDTSRTILMQAIEGYSNEEIAQKMNISVNTVKTHKARSYALLRRNLGYLRALVTLLSIH